MNLGFAAAAANIWFLVTLKSYIFDKLIYNVVYQKTGVFYGYKYKRIRYLQGCPFASGISLQW